MPLLKKKAFEKVTPQEYLRDDEEVFYCELTNEVFRNYEEFAERMLLCTSMVWTCAMTGKSNLTYEEALESEENARKTISEFPVELRIPVLYVATKTKRTGFGDMAEDVFHYCKDRYFIGEKVESCFTANKWVESHVLQVIAPSKEVIKKHCSPNSSPDKQLAPSPSLYKYEIEHLDENDQDISEIMIVDHNQLRRKKGNFSREKCKLFLKQHVQQDSNLHWIIKPADIKEFGIDKIKFENIFSGPEPFFDPSKKYEKKLEVSNVVNGKKSRQETLAKYLTKLDGPQKTNGASGNVETSKTSQQNSAQFLEEMERKKEEYNRMKQQKEEDQKWVATQLRNWNQPKEDLELIDQQLLPDIPDLISKIPDKYIGDVVMLMEFVKKFSNSLKPKKFIQGSVTMKLMERALLEAEVAGPLVDLIQMFLHAILEQGEESPGKATFLKNIDLSNMSVEDATKFATLAAHWPKKSQGLYLKELPLYSLTVSEVLRLHLLSSGAKLQEAGEKKRFYLRGGYSSSDDPGLHLRIHKPHIIKALAFKNVTQLELEDKIDILTCLMYQLLTFPTYRDTTEEQREKSLQAKFKVRALQRELRKSEAEFQGSMKQLKRKLKKKEPGATEEIETLENEESKKKMEIISDLEENTLLINDEEILLGMDRAYRKYLKLSSIPAVFVDGAEENPGRCLEKKIGQVSELVDADRSVISKYLEKNIDTLRKDKLKQETPVTNGVAGSHTNGIGNAENGHDKEDTDDLLMMCSADPNTCKVHSDVRAESRWKLLCRPESLDEFILALNKRGIREGELSDALKYDKEQLEKNILETPGYLWGNEDEADSQMIIRSKKTYIEANFGFPAGTPIDEILQNTLTDEILEMDEKIYTGGLGQLRVKNREEWRNALSNKDYKNFDREISRRVLQKKEAEVADKEEDDVSEEAIEIKMRFADQDPGNFLGPVKEKTKEQSSDTKEAIECLAVALAQVAHSIEPKFLEKPLGNSDSRKLSNYIPTTNCLDNWEKSLLLSTSFSQIFLHFSTLDASVMWRRSTHQAKCRQCNRRTDSENMLLCDNCNGGYHLYCLKPKLKQVPNGQWFCKHCEAIKEKAERHVSSEVLPKKKRRVFKEEEEDDFKNEIHSNGDTHVKVEEIKVELCSTCNSGGILISCTECGTPYHKECVVPPVSRTKQNWVCVECKNDPEDYQEEPKVQNNNDRSTRRSKRSDRESKKNEESDDNSSDSDNYPLVRAPRAVGIISNERRCAAKARHTISNFVKSLRRLSPTNDDSDSGDSSKNTTRRKRSLRRECGRDDLPLHNAALQDLLQEVMKHPDAWPFLRPVKNYEVPDYHDLISHPMDFGTIKYKLNMGEYQTDSQVMNDAALVFHNCNIYNEVNSEIHRCGQTVLKIFRNKCEELGFELPSKLEEEVSDTKRRRKLY